VSPSPEQDLLDVAVEAARRAGQVLVEYFRRPARGLDTKTTPTDLVSDADKNAEELIRTILAARRPNDGIVGEEGVDASGTSGIDWIVDPLDGTVNFLYGRAQWCVSIAAEDAEGAVIGVIHDPNGDETFTAIRGGGALLGGTPIRVSACEELSKALIGTGFAYAAEVRRAQAEVVARLLPRVRDVRRAGSAALDLAALACGRLDGFYESAMERWDRSAGVLIASEAGAVVTDLEAPAGMSTGVVGANPALHPALEALVTAHK
jgi:myo-inositol-1(or 4)-monophosphatase